MDEAKMCQYESGESRRAAAVSWPGICARLASISPRINSLWGSDVYRTNASVRAVKE